MLFLHINRQGLSLLVASEQLHIAEMATIRAHFPSKKVPRKNRDVFRGASLGVFRAFFENEKRSKTLKDAQKREK